MSLCTKMAIQPHFLMVSVAAPGHINPVRQLACRLARFCGVRSTIAIPKGAYARLFGNKHVEEEDDDEEEEDGEGKGLVTYTPYSNGSDSGFKFATDIPKMRTLVVESLTSIAARLQARGQPITCIIYALFLSVAADAARNLGIPSVLFWIQSSAVFAICHRCYSCDYASVIADHQHEPSFLLDLPGFASLRIQDLPSFVHTKPNADDPYYSVFILFEQVFGLLGKEISSGSRPTVLVNTFEELESGVLSSIDDVDVFPVGPLVSPGSGLGGIEHDASDYMKWLDSKGDKSVVYVSFGSMMVLPERQMEEILRGLEESGRPYVWVIRKDSKYELGAGNKLGVIVEWCDQVRVLSHRSVGCFVTHCGWNSTTESMLCGVPMVLLPRSADQVTNARQVEVMWGTGARAEANEEGLVEGKELRRCLDVVMGEDDRGVELRKTTDMWSTKARLASDEGGSSIVNMRAFVERFSALSS